MTEFLQEVADRIDAARRSLDQARADGDDYLVQVRTGEIESLQRLKDEHGGGKDVNDREPSAVAPVAVDDSAGVTAS